MTIPLHLAVEGRTLLVGCVDFVVYMQYVDAASVRDFFERSMNALGDRLTHYIAESMRRHAPVDARARTSVETWITRGRPGRSYWMELRGSGPDSGCSDSSVTLALTFRQRPRSAEELGEIERRNREMYEIAGVKATPPISSLRVSLPFDHPLASPDALLAWVREFRVVSSTELLSAHAGMAVNIDAAVSDSAALSALDARLGAALARHPGLNWEHFGSVANHLLRYVPGKVDLVPRIKRAQWLTILRDDTLDLCGGRGDVLRRLAEAPHVDTFAADRNLIIRAGPRPAIGDVTRRDLLPEYRHVASVLSPARLERHAGFGAVFTDERAQEWLEAFERDHD